MSDDPKKRQWKVIYFFRVRDGKEVLCLHEDEVRKACKHVPFVYFRTVCERLGIEIGTP